MSRLRSGAWVLESVSEVETDYVFVDSLLNGDDKGLRWMEYVGNEPARAGEGREAGNSCHQLESQLSTILGEEPGGWHISCHCTNTVRG